MSTAQPSTAATVWLLRTAFLPGGAAPDVSFVPPLVRRRLSPLQRAGFALAHEIAPAGAPDAPPSYTLHFSSQDGEFQLSHRLCRDYNDGLGVSPARFSSSVYNAMPGLYSILTKNTASYNAVAAGVDSAECGLLEALLDDTSGLRLWIHAEETDCGRGMAALLSSAPAPGAVVIVRAPATPGAQHGNLAALARFLRGEADVFNGALFTLSRAATVAKGASDLP